MIASQIHKVEIISNGIGSAQLINMVFSFITISVTLFNVRYTIKKDKDWENTRRKKEKETRLELINSFWHRELCLKNLLQNIVNIDLQIMEAYEGSDISLGTNTVNLRRKRRIREVTSNIADIIYTSTVDKCLEKSLTKINESFEDEIINNIISNNINKSTLKDLSTKYRKTMVEILYKYELNGYKCN